MASDKVNVMLIDQSFLAALRELESTTTVRTAQRLTRIGRDFEKYFISKQLSGRPGLNRGSGSLARSMYVGVSGGRAGSREVTVLIGFGGQAAVYAWAHELGLTVVPKTKQWLAFPFPNGPADKRQGALRPSAFTNLFFIKSKKDPLGTAFLVEGRARGKKIAGGVKTFINPVFILKKRIKLPERLLFVKTFEHEQSAMLGELELEVEALAAKFNTPQ